MEINMLERKNKSMDLDEFDPNKLKKLCNEIIDLEDKFSKLGLKISSWYGNINKIKFYDKLEKLNRGYKYKAILPTLYDKKYPSFLVWEIYNVFYGLNLKPGQTILDIGGACSLFSFYMASKGINVIAIDKNPELVNEANRISRFLGLSYNAIECDALDYVNNYSIQFDAITSICVFEHIEKNKRMQIMKNLHRILDNNGKIALTFDYRNPSQFVGINTPEDIYSQFGCNPNLEFDGNQEFYDNNKNYLVHGFFHWKFFIKYKIRSIKKGNFKLKDFFKIKFKNDYTFGVVFLKKKPKDFSNKESVKI